ncbi:aliphatic sulfonate ABC transporter substrate-binding protein [Sporolactobacillus sp. STSJ-5]|uniref:aliphatic sulfonate ABC transporter substrate-binding protein n=1 Tax=Sporolactobacillus sp. STSJ-5 TaxID=2965076 RepID=UPI0021046745|nr:aliphatic sulfonate ABC transporter substrate-binding protein [Sporolactobacillus sp. STSJ-5]MCQ2009468.1 aliphatic sulfonate ABC transporter substrate-binding protein [Sporolactobacillus sp. STSJ-5]
MRKIKFISIISIFMAAILALAGCGAQSQSSSSKNGKLTHLSIGYQQGIPLLTTVKQQGKLDARLKKMGITVSWHQFSSTTDMMNAVGVSNGVDFGGGGATASIFAQASGKKFVKVAAQDWIVHGSAILVRADSPIKSVADLKGKTIAVAKGSAQQYLLVSALKQVGLKYSDIKPLYIQPSEALAAFKKGKQFDAWAIWDPITAQAQASVKSRVIADNGSVFGKEASLQTAPYYFATPTLVKSHPEVVKIILDELAKAGAWAKKDPEASAKLLSKAYNSDYNIMLTEEKRAGSRKIVPVTDQLLSMFQTQADTFYNLKVVPKKIDAKDKNYNWNYKTEK